MMHTAVLAQLEHLVQLLVALDISLLPADHRPIPPIRTYHLAPAIYARQILSG